MTQQEIFHSYLKQIGYRLIDKNIPFCFRGGSIEITSSTVENFHTLTAHNKTWEPIFMDGYFNQVDNKKIEEWLYVDKGINPEGVEKLLGVVQIFVESLEDGRELPYSKNSPLYLYAKEALTAAKTIT